MNPEAGLHRHTHDEIQRNSASALGTLTYIPPDDGRSAAAPPSGGATGQRPTAAAPSAVPAARIDYARELRRRSTDPSASTATEPPLLLLAPMEVLADRAFRRAFASSVGGADEVCQEFIRVPDALPQGACPSKYALGLASHYDPHELPGVSLAPQVRARRPSPHPIAPPLACSLLIYIRSRGLGREPPLEARPLLEAVLWRRWTWMGGESVHTIPRSKTMLAAHCTGLHSD